MPIPTIFLSSIRSAAVGWVARYSRSVDAVMESARLAARLAAASSDCGLTLVLTLLLLAWTTMSKYWSTMSGTVCLSAIELVVIKREKRENKACT